MARQDVKSLSPERIELAKVAERQIDFITPQELARLLKAPEGNDIKDLRDKAILELLFSTGLRVSEMCSLSREIDFTRDEFSVRGKGEKVRVVFLSDEAKKAIKNYLDKRGDIDNRQTFSSHSPLGGKNRQTLCNQSWHFEKSYSARYPPFFCYRPSFKWRRYSLRAITSRSRFYHHDADLYSRYRQTFARSSSKVS